MLLQCMEKNCIHSVIIFVFFRDVLVTSIDSDITYEGLRAEMKDICRFDDRQPFTMKWVDEEGKLIRAVLCKKVWVGMSCINLFDHPPLEFQFFAGYPHTESQIS